MIAPFTLRLASKTLQFVFLILVYSCTGAFAQHISTLSVRHFTAENGLPQNSIKAISMDSLGFVWMATENGLVRFDGAGFKVFNRSNTAISSNRFFDFNAAMAGDTVDFYAHVPPLDLVGVRKGRVYVDSALTHSSARRLRELEKTMKGILLEGSHYRHMPPKSIIPVPHSPGNFYVCQEKSIDFFQNWKRRSTALVDGIVLSKVFRMGETLLVLLPDGSFAAFEGKHALKRHTLRLSGDILADPLFRNSPDKITVYWNNTADQSFAVLADHIYTLDMKRETVETKLILSGFDPKAHLVRTIFYDNNHRRIFLASLAEGLYEIQNKNFRVVSINDESVNNIFYTQAAVNDSTITISSGFNVGLGASGRQFRQKLPDIQKLIPFSWFQLVDSKGTRWLRADQDVVRVAADNKRILGRWHIGKEPIGIYEDSRHVIWIQLINGMLYTADPALQFAAPKPFVRGPQTPTCYADHGDTLWIGADRGLFRLNIRTRKLTPVAGTEAMNIRSIYLAKPGQLWFTTYEHGFFLIEHGRLISFPPDEQKRLATAHCIYEDKNHFFWITTNNGLFQIAKDDLLSYAHGKLKAPYYHLYVRESGFGTNEFNGGCQPCALRLGNGYLSLPSMAGLVWFKPETIKAEIPSGAFFVDEVEVGGKPVPLSGSGINLPFDPDEVRIRIAAPYFGNPENQTLFYALQLDGEEDKNWTKVENGGIHFSSLPSGEHTLLIRKHTGFGTANERQVLFRISVQKTWYETILAKGMGILLVVAGVFGYIRLRLRKLSKRNEQLEEAIAKRTESLNQTLDALQDSENSLTRQVQVQARMIASLTHDVRTPLNAVKLVSLEIERMIREEKYAMATQIGQSIADTISRVSVLLENTVTYMKVQLTDHRVASETVNLHDLIAQKIRLFSLAAQKNNTRLTNNVSHEQMIRCNHYLLGILLSNLIDNATKNTLHGTVTMEAEVTGTNSIIISVSDTGYGIPVAVMDWLNQEFPTRDTPETSPTTGLGLVIVKEVARMMGATIQAERMMTGSRVSILFEAFR
ncbi:Signal transduction histidine kinase [Dyadobacter soli]|uniref:histidine kinase n=1 Tax=Dyadobacter soli TaxID=659014 RepID=A0A1G7FF23_9BACT|nr:HAMP domain-containing sensor histidine kinase [Dyadobacter soli]SDE74165.1 Signal transduction histidine kinase [Dyadobacter soli]